MVLAPLSNMIEGVDYTIDEQSGLMILTAFFLEKRGYCCGKGCVNCCYIPIHTKGATKLKDDPDE